MESRPEMVASMQRHLWRLEGTGAAGPRGPMKLGTGDLSLLLWTRKDSMPQGSHHSAQQFALHKAQRKTRQLLQEVRSKAVGPGSIPAHHTPEDSPLQEARSRAPSQHTTHTNDHSQVSLQALGTGMRIPPHGCLEVTGAGASDTWAGGDTGNSSTYCTHPLQVLTARRR